MSDPLAAPLADAFDAGAAEWQHEFGGTWNDWGFRAVARAARELLAEELRPQLEDRFKGLSKCDEIVDTVIWLITTRGDMP
jgi:hypothetical protein